MRSAFIEELIHLAKKDERIWLLTGDLGYNVLESFEKEFPERFVNAGVAEQNMAGMAAGLAMDGRVVFTYSIANFPTLRCLEQIRNDICYHNVNVKIVSVGAGVAYGTQGYSHHGVEDIGILRCLPNIKIVSPGDAFEARRAVQLAVETPGPMYIRLGRNNEPDLHKSMINFRLGESIKVYEGNDVVLIATGSIAYEALKATEMLRLKGLDAGFISFPFVKPLDVSVLDKIIAINKIKWIITVEEHCPYGGLGSAIAEILSAMDSNTRLFRITLPDLIEEIGGQAWLLNKYGLSAEGIYERVINLVKN
jgi:transketolase